MNITDTTGDPFSDKNIKTLINGDIVSRLEGKILLENSRVLNIVLDLKPRIFVSTTRGFDYDFLTDPLIEKISRRLRKSLNRHFFGNAAKRNGKRIEYFAFMHHDPHSHLHIIAELPEGRDLQFTRDFVIQYCAKDPWISPNYIDETRSVSASTFYNHRGSAQLLL